MLRLVKLSPDLVGTTSASILAYLLVAAKKFIVALPKKHGMHVFWTWAPFFWTCTCFLDLTRIFLDLGSQKMWGTCLCVFWTLWEYFLWTCMNLFWTHGNFFATAKLIVSELGLCFLDPCTCFVDLASIGWGAQVGGTLGGHGGTRYKTTMNAGNIDATWMQRRKLLRGTGEEA